MSIIKSEQEERTDLFVDFAIKIFFQGLIAMGVIFFLSHLFEFEFSPFRAAFSGFVVMSIIIIVHNLYEKE